MIDLIRKRHEGPAWVVVPEVPNGTGSNVSRRADAIALGLWPSRGYEIHGYEVKVSRGDVRKELNDPSKADAVGRFCDYWWLVVEDLSIIDGLVVPSTWGILAPTLGAEQLAEWVRACGGDPRCALAGYAGGWAGARAARAGELTLATRFADLFRARARRLEASRLSPKSS